MTQTTTITSIKREFNLFPNIVGIVTTANLTTITTTGYWLNELNNVEFLNNGVWQWEAEDLVLIYYATAQIGFFTFDAATNSFVALADNGNLSNTLPSGDIFVGNGANVATAVTMSGAATIDNTGAVTLANNAVDFANLAADVAKQATVTLSSAQILGMYGTPVQLIAAPGSGKLILIDDITWDVAFGTTQYAAGGAIAAQYGNTVHGGGPAASSSLAAATLNGVAASSFLTEDGSAGVVDVAKTASLNTAVYLSNATAAFTTGDSTATLYVRYRVITPA